MGWNMLNHQNGAYTYIFSPFSLKDCNLIFQDTVYTQSSTKQKPTILTRKSQKKMANNDTFQPHIEQIS